MPRYVVGVDGCRAGWIACRLAITADGAAFRSRFYIYNSFEELMAAEAQAAAIAIDIPIGLNEDWTPRRCDREARKLLGTRGASVFPAPPRVLLERKTYRATNEDSQQLFQRGLSQQTFHIFPKIAEVDRFLRTQPHRLLYEVHPELCFRMLRQEPLAYGKKTAAGYEERRQILQRDGPLVLPPQEGWRAALDLRGYAVQRDDVADAAVAALTAVRIADGRAHSIPEHPKCDRFGIPMRMLY